MRRKPPRTMPRRMRSSSSRSGRRESRCGTRGFAMRSVRQRKRKHAIFKGSGGTRFGVPTSPGVNPLTMEQLGKLVAMSVRWPLFFSDLEQDHDLLAKLHNWQMTPRSDAEISVVGRYWLAKNSFTQLLEFPLLPNKERPEMDSMARIPASPPLFQNAGNGSGRPTTQDPL